jgi:predicted ester cyclase
VVVHDRVRGTHPREFMEIPATAHEATTEFIHIVRVADGRIAERWGLIDAMGLMQQLGALPGRQPTTA